MEDGKSGGFWKIVGILAVGAAIGVIGTAATTEVIHATSTVEFCGSACHSMQYPLESYKRSPHYANGMGVRAVCSDCHIPYHAGHANPVQYVQLMIYKAKAGITDVIAESKGVISTPEKYEAERARLGKEFRAWLKENNSVTCRGCHDLTAFKTEEEIQEHKDALQSGSINCLECHRGVGHVRAKKEEKKEDKKADAPAGGDAKAATAAAK